MGKKNDSKMQAHAAWMKDKKITRKTGQCPMCQRPFLIGQLMNHLNRCAGR